MVKAEVWARRVRGREREGRRKGMLLLALLDVFWRECWERCRRKGAASRRREGGREEQQQQVRMEESIA